MKKPFQILADRVQGEKEDPDTEYRLRKVAPSLRLPADDAAGPSSWCKVIRALPLLDRAGFGILCSKAISSRFLHPGSRSEDIQKLDSFAAPNYPAIKVKMTLWTSPTQSEQDRFFCKRAGRLITVGVSGQFRRIGRR